VLSAAIAAILPGLLSVHDARADILGWNTGSGNYFSASWIDVSQPGDPWSSPAQGDTMFINQSATITYNAGASQYLNLSSTSSEGQVFNIYSGTFDITQGGGAGYGYGLLLDNGGAFNVTNSAGYTTVNIAGPLTVGQDGGNTATATIAGGVVSIGTSSTAYGTMYIGLSGNGTLTQTGTPTVSAPALVVAAEPGSSGLYNMQGGTLTIAGTTSVANTTGSITLGGGVLTTGSLSLTNPSEFNWTGGGTLTLTGTGTSLTGNFAVPLYGALNVPTSASMQVSGTLSNSGVINLSGGSLTTGSITQSGGTFDWTGGTLNVTSGSLTVDTSGALGASLNLNSGQNLYIDGTGQGVNVSGTLNASGGVLSVTTLTTQSSGTVNQSAGNVYAGAISNAGAINFSGGLLVAGSVNSTGSGQLNWTGGTLELTGTGTAITGNFAIPSGGTLDVLSSASLQVNGAISVNATSLVNHSGSVTAGSVQITPASPSLYGSTVTLGYRFLTQSTVYTGTGYAAQTFQVNNSQEVTSWSDAGANFNVSSNSILVTFDQTVYWSSGAFNGWVINDAGNSVAPISGVSIDSSTNLSGLTSSDVSFDNNDIYLNWQGLNVTPSTVLRLDITFAQSEYRLSGGTLKTGSINTGGNPADFSWTSGTLNITGTGSSFGGTITVPSSGILKLDGAITDPIAVTPGGVFDLDANTGTGILQRTLNTITLSSGSVPYGQVNVVAAINHANRQFIVTAGLTMAGTTNAWQGLVDLANNDMDVQGGSLTNITNQIKEGYGNGNWNGAAGIVSTSAASNTSHLTMLGVILNGTTYGSATGSLGMFDGIYPAATDVLVKFTYYGDTNLDGAVDGSDYTNIDNGFHNHLTGWQNGDFNYDAVVDGSDYTLIDNAYNIQGATLGSNPAALIASDTEQIRGQIAGTAAVPEPGSLCLIATDTIGILALRRKRWIANGK
jgi:hypothetical protein